MKSKFFVILGGLVLTLAYLLTNQLLVAGANQPLQNDRIFVNESFQTLLGAGEDAPELWGQLSTAEQDEILRDLFPDLVAQGKRADLMEVAQGESADLQIELSGSRPPADITQPLQNDPAFVNEQFQTLLTAGEDAPALWNRLTVEEQDEILRDLFSDLVAQGKRADLIDVYEVPAQLQASGTIEPQWCTGYYVVQNGNNPLGAADGPYVDGYGGPGGATLTLGLSESVSNAVNANVGVSAQVVSAGVGFNVAYTTGVVSSTTINVPAYETRRLQAFYQYNGTGFEVWDDDCGTPADTYVGSGIAWQYTNILYSNWRVS